MAKGAPPQTQNPVVSDSTASDIDMPVNDEEPDNSLSFLLKQTGNTKWELFTWGFGGGIMLPLKETDMMSLGTEVKYDMLLGVRMRYHSHSVSTGISFDCRWYCSKGDRGFMKTDNGRFVTSPYPESSKRHSSFLQVGSLQIPLIYGFKFGANRDFEVLGGPVANFNLFGRMSTAYTMKSDPYDVRTSFSTRRIGQIPVTLEIMGIVRYKYVGLYAKYAPMRMFHASTGINVRYVSLGLMLMFDN
ncbi:MAG: hypothetical protein HDR88_09500 [Bacteroides sp.]|nr:hypothetical protein [Bacteroides sp.]